MPWMFSDDADRTLAARIRDLTPAMGRAEAILHAAVSRNFERESAGDDPWAALAPSTIEGRVRAGYPPGPILQRTHALASSISGGHGKDFAEVGTGVEYGQYHQTGTRKMPARPFLIATERDLDLIGEAIADYIAGK